MSKIKETFLDFFDDLEDPRIERGKLYSVHEILLVTICALICGAESWRDLVIFGKEKLEFLRDYLPFENGIPCKNTFCRFFAALDPSNFKECFIEWVKSLHSLEEDIVAIDGKRLCNSFDKLNSKSAIHMVSAFAVNARLVLGQQKVDEKSNEITAIPKLLNLINIKNCIVTIDAMGCQKDIAETIVQNGGDYVLALKGNHSILHKDVEEFFDDKKNIDSCEFSEEIDKGHGRIEVRKCWTTDKIEWLGELRFPYMKSISCIEAHRSIGGNTTIERRFYINSVSTNSKKINAAVRSHWAVENCLHWTLDVIFDEDNSRIRSNNAAENIAIVRHTSLNLLQNAKSKYKNCSLKALRKKAGWGNSTLKAILEQKF